ncbi:MAG TPA: hypothetical protein VFE16_02050 [Candidatus Cybelea sp.]|nr:hypothetical protein [Candidatus Cybelea sp.]
MSRVVGVVASAALALALNSGIAVAAGLLPTSAGPDLASRLMLQLFGETTDASASFAAAQGDRASESPLHELALQLPRTDDKPDFTAAVSGVFSAGQLAAADFTPGAITDAAAAALTVGTNVVRFSPAVSPDDDALAPRAPRLTAAYQAPTEPAVSPDPGTLAFVAPEMRAPDFLSSTAQVGAVHFDGEAEGKSTQTPQLSLGDTSADAGANFNLRAGKRNLDVNLSSEYEHVGRNDASGFTVTPLDSASSWQLPGAGAAPLLVPSYANLNRLSLGAGLSVPVVHGLTLNLNYDAQHLYGGYGLPGLLNLDTINNTYGGKLTFNLPQISSSLSIGAYQDRFQDNLSLNGTTQTREDVNFTVKF